MHKLLAQNLFIPHTERDQRQRSGILWQSVLLPPKKKIGQAIYDIYKPQSAEEIQDALKKISAPIFEAAFKGEMENHLVALRL